ncbi:MAG: ATP-dependent DNA helicase, partial [Microgenomates group bacterium]
EIHYFLIDEYQDTNSAQNQVISLLASWWEKEANVFVVGDPHQSIYRFQGASLENMMSFMEQYPNAKIVTLTEGYRCTQPVYDAAHAVISRHQLTTKDTQKLEPDILEALSTILQSQKKSGESPTLFAAPTLTAEAVFVGQEIKSLIDAGEKPEDIAILYRNRAHASEFESVLMHLGIPFQVQGGVNVLKTELIRQLLTFFQTILDIRQGTEDQSLFEVLCYAWTKVSPIMALKLVRSASLEKISMLQLLSLSYQDIVSKQSISEITESEINQAKEFIKMLQELSTLDSDHHFVAWFELALKNSGFLDWVLASDEKTRLLTLVTTVFNQAKALANQNHETKLLDFMNAIAVMIDHGIKLTAEDVSISPSAVTLTTVHSAKGLEWKHVFVVRLLDGIWGNARSRNLIPLPDGIITHSDVSKKERNEDDRRLFYVAITRAKESVTLTYPETDAANGRVKELLGSMFAVEIDSHIKQFSEKKITAFFETAQDKIAELLLPAEIKRSIEDTEKEFFRHIIERYTLSVTGLNKYLQDKKAFVLEDLLRVPRAKVEYLSYGSAIHVALETFYKRYQRDGTFPDLEVALTAFQRTLEKELMTSADYGRRLEQGKNIIQKYLAERQTIAPQVLYIEHQFGSGMSSAVLKDIRLSGRIDRVDWIDKSKKTVRVIDYKTGSAKSENYINGAIASAQLSEREQTLPDQIKGRYKRQLLFYKLLGDLDPSFVPIITEGSFDFVEPSGSAGIAVERNFLLLPEDVALLKELIIEVVEEIRSLQFLETIDFSSQGE